MTRFYVKWWLSEVFSHGHAVFRSVSFEFEHQLRECKKISHALPQCTLRFATQIAVCVPLCSKTRSVGDTKQLIDNLHPCWPRKASTLKARTHVSAQPCRPRLGLERREVMKLEGECQALPAWHPSFQHLSRFPNLHGTPRAD